MNLIFNCRIPIPIKFAKLHRILPCHASYHEHAGSCASSYNGCIGCLYSVRFFTDRTVELMRATTSSPTVSPTDVFQASIPPSATYFSALPLSILLALCYDAIVVSILLLFTLQPIYCLPSTTYYPVCL